MLPVFIVKFFLINQTNQIKKKKSTDIDRHNSDCKKKKKDTRLNKFK
jgi:hypothetical protein